MNTEHKIHLSSVCECLAAWCMGSGLWRTKKLQAPKRLQLNYIHTHTYTPIYTFWRPQSPQSNGTGDADTRGETQEPSYIPDLPSLLTPAGSGDLSHSVSRRQPKPPPFSSLELKANLPSHHTCRQLQCALAVSTMHLCPTFDFGGTDWIDDQSIHRLLCLSPACPPPKGTGCRRTGLSAWWAASGGRDRWAAQRIPSLSVCLSVSANYGTAHLLKKF